LNVVGGGNNAKMIDNTNLFEVDNTATTTNAQATINFSSLTSSYNFELDGQAVTITSAQIEAGTAATAIITALNTAAAGSAGGLSSLVGATAPTVDYEVVQNGNTVTITKKGGDDGVMAGAPAGSDDNNIFISDFTATANPAVAATTASYEQNGVAGTSKDLAEVGYGTYTSGQATATKMAVEVSGDATYSFRLTNLAGSGQHTTAITAAVVGGSMATMIAAVNNETAHTGITAAADPNNNKAMILTRADGLAIKLDNFTATDDGSMLATPDAGQGTPKRLNDDPAVVAASATAAGAAVKTVATMAFAENDKYQFRLNDGNTVAVVRATTVSTGASALTAMLTEVNAALTNSGSDITAVIDSGKLKFENAKGGKIEVLGFTSDGGGTSTFAPSTGQGSAVIMNDDADVSLAGKSIAQISVTTAGGSSEALQVIDNALQQVNNERSKLGALQNRLVHTVDNLNNVVTNTEASKSRIMDTDYATETTNLAKAQIIQQAATAMLAQANQSSQSVLSLLQ